MENKLEQYFDCVGPGWTSILRALGKCFSQKEKLIPNSEIRIAQIKEKFGLIRIYVDIIGMKEREGDEIYGAIEMAERMSAQLCEECGSTDGVETRPKLGSKFGWVKTYCKNCHEKRDNL